LPYTLLLAWYLIERKWVTKEGTVPHGGIGWTPHWRTSLVSLQPRCRQCGSSIDVVGEGFVVERTSVADYFGVQSHGGRKPPDWMKDAVLKGFGGRCAGCRKTLTPGTATFDHVVARAKRGITDLTNLQPLCKQCNQTKADQDVEVVEVSLTFPLRPLPPDGYEGVIW
jgi:5-methylcytosine-specific restriction endonuclease McrA